MRRIGWVAAGTVSAAGATSLALGYARDSARHTNLGIGLLAVGLTAIQDLRAEARAKRIHQLTANNRFAAAFAAIRAEAEPCGCTAQELPARTPGALVPFRPRAATLA